MEFFDIVDENGNPTGEIISRADAHAMGICHRTAHIWVVRKLEGKYQVLLQKRSADKDSFPGCYDTSSAGHIQAGDAPLDSAIRELGEELGIEAEKEDLTQIGSFDIAYEKEFYGKMFRDNEYSFVYVYEKDVDISKLSLQKEEVESVAWFDLDIVADAIAEPRDPAFCIPTGGFRLIQRWCRKTD